MAHRGRLACTAAGGGCNGHICVCAAAARSLHASARPRLHPPLPLLPPPARWWPPRSTPWTPCCCPTSSPRRTWWPPSKPRLPCPRWRAGRWSTGEAGGWARAGAGLRSCRRRCRAAGMLWGSAAWRHGPTGQSSSHQLHCTERVAAWRLAPPALARGHRLVDAAVFEAIPFRSAIADGCTHVLVLNNLPKVGRAGRCLAGLGARWLCILWLVPLPLAKGTHCRCGRRCGCAHHGWPPSGCLPAHVTRSPGRCVCLAVRGSAAAGPRVLQRLAGGARRGCADCGGWMPGSGGRLQGWGSGCGEPRVNDQWRRAAAGSALQRLMAARRGEAAPPSVGVAGAATLHQLEPPYCTSLN